MLRRIATCLAALCLTMPCIAQSNVQTAPRVPLPKRLSTQIVLPESGEIRLIVKFSDDVRARATADGRVASLTNHDMSNVLNLAAQTGVTFKQAINHSLDKLASLELRASALSKRGQPDLAGMMYVKGPKAVMLQVARALNDMPNVEFVEFEPEWVPHQNFNIAGNNKDKNKEAQGDKQSGDQDDGQQGGDPLAGGGGINGCGNPNATPCDTASKEDDEPFCNDTLCCEAVCAIDPTCCEDVWDDGCVNWQSTFCTDLPEIICGEPLAGSCVVAHLPWHYACDDAKCCESVCAINPFCCDTQWDQACANVAIDMCNQPACGDPGQLDCYDAHPPGNPFCNDPGCCEITCSIDPSCCETVWDTLCANEATIVCGGAEVCNQFAGPCLSPHAGIGCRFASCCESVCEVDPGCCSTGWDQQCADIATDICPTPDFTALQGYKTLDWYFDSSGNNPPDNLAAAAPYTAGFTGEGHDMPGLWIMGGGNSPDNLTRGKGAKIGVIEHSAWVDHEDLINQVISEPGQTIIHGEGGFISSNHGTATLGIVVAEDNGIGITGMAPEAQGYFFPIISVEEGSRTISAMVAAALVFEHGDVLSFSFGPAPPPSPRTLDSVASTNLTLRFLSDLGIVCVISAGNECGNLDQDDPAGNALPDSGAITVGAGTPGASWCRLGFSNHGDCNGRVHCQTWGSNVMTTGYGTLYNPSPDDPQHHYTNVFNGTSAAAPIIAGLAVDLQGFAKMIYGIPLMPDQIRDLLTENGFTQCGAPSCNLLAGAPNGQECAGDFDPDEPPNAIGVIPDPIAIANVIVNTPWFDGSPFVEDIEILRGTLVSGNKFSIKASDNNRLVIKSEFTQANDNQPLGINYMAAGQITDLLVHARITGNIPVFQDLRVAHEGHQSDAPFVCDPPFSGIGLTFTEMWDWNQNKWSFVGVTAAMGLDPPQLDCPIPVDVAPFGQRFVRESDGKMQLRIWSLSLGGNFGGFGGGGALPYNIRHDWINISTSGIGGSDQPTPP